MNRYHRMQEFGSRKQIREEYEQWLKQNQREPNPHSAHLFAMSKTEGSGVHLGYSEREIILMLEGDLPEAYD